MGDDNQDKTMMNSFASRARELWTQCWEPTRLALTQVLDKRLPQYASALAFNTVLAIVPLVALFFAIARGFGYGGIIEATVRGLLSSQPDAANYIIQFANSYLSNARSSAIIGFGVLVMLYSVIGLINNIETVFNDIWEVKRQRRFSHKLMSYLSMFILVPITLVIVSGIHLAVRAFIGESTVFQFLAPVLKLLINLIPMIVLTIVFTVVFIHVPNTRVRLRHAIVPALLTAIFMELLQRAYVYGQVFLSSYNAIYGSLAALPLFMLWVQFSWYIILFFALLSHTSQHHDYYGLCGSAGTISHDGRTLLAGTLLGLVCRGFVKGDEHYTAQLLQQQTGIPMRIVTGLLEDLCAVRLLEEREGSGSAGPTYAPYEDVSNLTVSKMLEKLNSHGQSIDSLDLAGQIDRKTMERINTIRANSLSQLEDVKVVDLWPAQEAQ